VTTSREPVLVIGAGVLGLTTGVVLAETGRPVRIRTAELPEQTTSAVAGAMWGPALLPPADRVPYWGTRSHAEFTSLANDPRTGVHLAPGRMAARFELGDQVPSELTLVPDLRKCSPEELPDGFVSGYFGTVPLLDMPRYLSYLVDRFRAAGGEIQHSPVPTLLDAAQESELVVNCSGVGAHELVGDPGVYPVRGQQVVVANPGIQEYFIEITAASEFVSWMPHGDRVLLGGVALEQDWGLVPDPEITAGILRRCGKAEPRLFGARVLGELNGLRPGREAVRVEIEHYEGATIVHNYGHGGCGVSLSWGCAFEVADMLTA
jgi:D-amino-acid oxidase